MFLDAKVEKVRDGGRVVNKALEIAHGVHETGRREILSNDATSGRRTTVHGSSPDSVSAAMDERCKRRGTSA